MKTKVKKFRFIAKIAQKIACLTACFAFSASAAPVAKVGGTEYDTLEAAFAALSSENYTLTLQDTAAWPAETPVHWAAGTQRGFATTLAAALTAGYKANEGAITIVCRPGADVGTMTHGHVEDALTIYGNDAYLSGGECDLEVDTFPFSRATGAQVNDGAYLSQDIAITAYELDNLGVWGQRHTSYTVTVTLTDCDGKALEGKENVQRVYISGTTGRNDITLTGCDFLTKKTAVYSNADGTITATDCTFTGGAAPFNINHKANGAVSVNVTNCSFKDCGDAGEWKQFAAPVRLVNSGAGTMAAAVTKCAFAETVGANGDILLGDGRTGQKSNDVTLKVAETAADIQAQKPGYYDGETTNAAKGTTTTTTTADTLETSVEKLLPPIAATIGTVSYETLGAAIAAVKDGETVVVNAGEYKLTGSQSLYKGKAFTIKAAEGAKVSFDMSAAVALHGAMITFEGVTFDYKTNKDYRGLQHADTLVYNDCTINGKVFLYAKSEMFNRCVFNQSAVDYNVWTYGAQKVAFNACTFNCAGKSVFVYTEDKNAKTDLTVASCEFKATAEATGKAAIEIDTSLMTDGGASVTIDDQTTATGFATGSNSGSALWNDKKQTKDTNKNVTVTVAGKTVFAPADGSKERPYSREQFGAMTRAEYIAAQSRLGGTLYVSVGDYSYDQYGTLGNGERNDTVGQIPDHSKLNAYGENGYLGEKNDGANGHTVVFVGGTITSGVKGYTSIDNIGTYLLLAVPAYTKVKFEKTTFNNVFSFNYQLYTSPWSQLGRLAFESCTFNGLIVGSIASTELAFDGCTFTDYRNAVSANNSNPTWIRPAYGNWTKDDNEGQGTGFRSLTSISFTGNTVTSTRPVKFERIAQWEMATTVTATGNAFDITPQEGDTSPKNVGLYFGANAKFDLVADTNTKSDKTEALYTATYTAPNGTTYAGLPAGSTVKNAAGEDVTIDDARVWKKTDALTLKTTEEVASVTNAKGVSVAFATLAEALAAAKDGETVTLLADVNGDGIGVPANAFPTGLVVDFAGHTYTVSGRLVGSSTTKSNAFQLLAGNKITFKNGSLVGATATAGEGTDWTGAPAILIQNYCDLTLERMTVKGGDETCYTLSNNNGDIVIADSTIVAGKGTRQGPFAFDVCRYSSYPSVRVTVKGDSVIDGNVEVSGTIGDGQSRQLDIEGGTFKGTFSVANQPANIAISGGTFSTAVLPEYCSAGFIPKANGDGTYGVKEGAYVAAIGDEKYETLAEAIAAAKASKTVMLIADTRENVIIDKRLTLDLNGFTLNGGTVQGKAALTVNAARVTIKDSSEAKTGMIKREDTAANSGTTSYYVLDIQGKGGFVLFEGGTVINDSGTTDGARKGASLVRIGDDGVSAYPQLTIKGGTFTQNNFVAIKVDRGTFYLTGGTINCPNDEAVKNWGAAIIKGGTVNGTVASWVYADSKASSTLTISDDATVNGNVYAMSYDGAEGKTAKVSITGGYVTGELGTYQGKNIHEKTALSDAEKASIGVTGGRFTKDPSAYLAEDSTAIKGEDEIFSVQKAYLARIGDTYYYTMDDAFHAANASEKIETIVLLRDYTTTALQNSGSKGFTLDLNGKTWTCKGLDANSAAFEINYPNVTLTVKNGKVVSDQLLGLIPSAMGGTITYDNAALVFEDVEATVNGRSGIETNGNNTNNSITLKGCSLTVADGYGIYFPSSGTLTIEDSVIVAKTMGVQVCAGTLSISGASKITVTGDAVAKVGNDGAIEDGAAVSVVNRMGYKALEKIVLAGGTFTAKAGNTALKAYAWANGTESAFDNAMGTITISGGTFSTAVLPEYCAAGFIPTANGDGTFGVKEGAFVAEIGTAKYETLEAALAAAQDGETVKLLADITHEGSQLVIAADKRLTLDLNGKTLKVSKSTAKAAQVSVLGSLTVTDGSAAQMGVICSDYTGTAGLVVCVEENGALTMKGGRITTEGMAQAGNAVKIATGGTVEMTGGTIDCDAKRNNVAVNLAGSSSRFTMTGGSVVADNGESTTAILAKSSGSTLAISDAAKVSGPTAVSVSAKSAATISGGTFEGTIKANKGVSGGTFDREVPLDACTDYHESLKNEDGTYGIFPFTAIDVKTSIDGVATVRVRVSRSLLDRAGGTTPEEKAANLGKPEANGNLAWVNGVMGLEADEAVHAVDVPQNGHTNKDGVFIQAPVPAPKNSDAAVSYSIDRVDADGRVIEAGTEATSGSLKIVLADIETSARFRVNVFVRSNDGTTVAKLVSVNTVGVLKTATSAKKAIVAVPWLSLADGGNISVANLVKTAGLTAGDKLHVYNKAESRYDVYELATDKTWTPKAIYKVGADGTVEAVSSGTPETTTVARGNGVWLERQDTTKAIVSYGQVASGTVATTVDGGTAEKPTWNLLAVPTTTAVDIAAMFGSAETDTLIVPTDGAPKVCTVKNGEWGYAKSVPVTDASGNQLGVRVIREKVTELPAGTGFWYLNGGAAKTVNW